MIELLGWCGAVVVLLSLTQRDQARLHVLNVVACLMFVGYDIALSLYSMLAMNVLLLGISAKQIRWHRAKHAQAPGTRDPVLSLNTRIDQPRAALPGGRGALIR